MTSTVDPSTASSSPTPSNSESIITVATDKAGQFTAIGDAIAYAQHNDIPTVTVLEGTYPAVTVTATPSVAVIGQSGSPDGFSENKVTISEAGTALTISVNVDGFTFANINFVDTASKGSAVQIQGTKLAFYSCQFISAGPVGTETGLGVGLIANSYIEAQETAIDGKATLYLFRTSISPIESSALVLSTLGTASDDVLYNSTIVFDRGTISPKPGEETTGIFLAKAKGPGSVAVYRNSDLDGFIAATGVHVDDLNQDARNLYGEYGNTGDGAYPNNKDARSPYVKLLSTSKLSPFALRAVLSGAYPDFATSDTSWIDPDILADIDKSDAASASTSTGDDGGTGGDDDDGDDDGDGGDGGASSTSSRGSGASSTTPSSPEATPTSSFVVSPDPSDGQYSSVTAAIQALANDGKPYIIDIKSGTYEEQITITRKGKVTLRGETDFKNDFTQNLVTIRFSDGVATKTNNDDKTPVINVQDSDGQAIVALYNINFKNTYPQAGDTVALAADFDGTVGAYGCSFIGYHHTLFANKGSQLFSNSYIEGSIDFIWGSATAYFHQSYIASNTPGYSITAQTHSSANGAGGFVIDTSLVTYTSSYGTSFGNTYLGRPAAEYSLVIYMNSYLNKHIAPEGWSSSGPSGTNHVTFGEFNNVGPGNWSDARASFAKKLSQDEADAYTLANWIGDTSWIDMTAYNLKPSYDISDPDGGSSPTTPGSGTSTSSSSPSGTSSGDPFGAGTSSSSGTGTSGHPASGTTPPDGAVLVSPSGDVDDSFSSLTAALKSLPSDGSLQVIFIYAGSYNEQVPSISRDGSTIIIGYATGDPGKDFSDNKVTISFSQGSSAPSNASPDTNADTATFSTDGDNIAVYNVNFINIDNLDGSKSSYVAIAASIFGSQNAFYACSFVAWQETLLTGGLSAYQYFESSYIEGATDFIAGSSKAYFKGCTIGAKSTDLAITLQSRASDKSTGGYIFDQCLFDAAPNAAEDLTRSVFLGRPFAEYAFVVVKYSYLSSIINPSGWEGWSNSDPRTDYVTFAEYKNTGQGNWEQNSDAREAVGFAKLLESDIYSLSAVMASTDWIDMTYWDSITTPEDEPGSSPGSPTGSAPGSSNDSDPDSATGSDPASSTGSAPGSSTTPDSGSGSSTGSASGSSSSSKPGSTTSAAPGSFSPGDADDDGLSGTTPPEGALIVSKTSIPDTKTYDTISDALKALSSSVDDVSTIFIYPGTYTERLKITTLGTVILIGYSESTKDFKNNQVTITNNEAGDIGSGALPLSSATVDAAGKELRVININISNPRKSVGESASVALAVESSKYASLYGSQVLGGQNALLIDGFLFAAESYIEGNVDMIAGTGSGYFLDSTISPNDDGINLTADQRSSADSPGGFVFDHSKVTPVDGAGTMVAISLGRPRSSYARVAYVYSHLGSCVEPAGWEEWTPASPRTANVLFGEYGNDGPGSNTAGRAPFATQLTDESVVQFEISQFFSSTSWIDFSRVLATPFSAGKTPGSSTPDSSDPDSSDSGKTTTTDPATSGGSSPTADPSSTNPSSTDPSSTDPSSTDPSSTDPSSTDPSGDTGSGTSAQDPSRSPDVVTKTITDSDVTSTQTATQVIVDGFTLTPTTVVKTSTQKSPTTLTLTTTTSPSVSTISKSATITDFATASSKTTSTKTITVLSIDASTPRTQKVTSVSTVTVGTGGTSTVSGKTQVVTSSTTSTKTVTTSVTTTLSCVPAPAARKVKGNLLPPRAVAVTTFTNHSTITAIVTALNTSPTGSHPHENNTTTNINIVQGNAATQLGNKIAVETSYSTVPDITTVTITKIFSSGASITLDPIISTTIITTLSTTTSVKTVEGSGSTSTVYTTTTTTSIVGPSVTIVTKTSTSKSVLNLPTPTSTKVVTSTVTNSPTVTTTSLAILTKTKTVKATSTLTNTVTTTSKNAPACS
ncbi:Pectinesterase catalytic [Penicillium malachiteum]|uniref:Pectinesterase catalytic n=1 Tax=Penicillium malachiteum TaxID=1324776 RepID=UPI002549B7E3|nr:Pectinesterase catalytic [Penicillium malachiteum]KAJ5715625.1 Pectinesterase catalytic [Penicillium malachiteum]